MAQRIRSRNPGDGRNPFSFSGDVNCGPDAPGARWKSNVPVHPPVKNLPAALVLFGLIVIAGPLLFGAVDRVVQIGVIALLTLGMALVPPAIPRTSRWLRIVLSAIALIIVLKEFAPATLFGNPEWRQTLMGNYGVQLSSLHHPEPALAIDALLVLVIAILWFLWSRTLTSVPAGATGVAWLLFTSAGVTALVWLCLGTCETTLIYGYRNTPGWTGFGPFPNRNHTANFLAMGALIGCGCVARAFLRRKILFGLAGLAVIATIVLAILESKSRGGLLAMAAGLGVFLLAAILRAPGMKTAGTGIAAMLFAATLLMTFGSEVIKRFATGGEGDVSMDTRVAIWNDTLGMWGNAPAFGHGISSFEPLFPLYQKAKLVGQYVIHPESSWLQWLAEMGLVVTFATALVATAFCFNGVRRAMTHSRNFYLRIGGLAAVFALAVHSIWDVPGHRWGTAGFALAALALACPIPGNAVIRRMPQTTAFAPLAITIFWIYPFISGRPLASPTALARLLILNANSQKASIEDLKRLVHYFPLDFRTHLVLGLRQLERPGEHHEGWQHLRTSLRLRPGSWALAVVAADASQRFSPGMALHFWSLAVERAGHRAGEILGRGTRATSNIPTADSYWGQFVESHPDLLLDYSLMLPEKEGRAFYKIWLAERLPRKDLSDMAIKSFYAALRKYGTANELKYWIATHPERESTDFRTWAEFLYSAGEVRDAWSLLVRHVKEPQFTAETPKTSRVILEARWHENPEDFVNVVAFAQVLQAEGKIEECMRIIRESSELNDPPTWIVRKAAFLYAESGDFETAVTKALQSLIRNAARPKDN
jgi:O-antigen ligase